ncbi:MAG: YeeE/YedE family protein [Pseudomonadales bacterium]|nr:YeeE/YedE family protein [Halioglobus sp.]MCP5131412.1 YeeE/YedE family protein [Pseudomonadales bacterium]
MLEYITAYTTPLIGGLLIGATAVALLYLLGRIAGIAGIVWGAVSAQPDNAWRWMFIVGLLAGPVLYHLVAKVPYPEPSPLPWWQAVAGGLLVGFGVKLGSGCTSGHGVCGIGRLSPRSLAATITFMATGIITVYVIRHTLVGTWL